MFGPDDAGRISSAVLYIGGSEGGQWFAEVRELILSWLPHAEDVVIQGAGHTLVLTHPAEVPNALELGLRVRPWRRT